MSGITVAGVTAAAAAVSAAAGLAGAVTSLGGGGKKGGGLVLPTPTPAAAPAPTSRNDTGSQVVVGADAVKNQRVGSGSNAARVNGASTTDVLGGLGAGGINI